MIYEGKITSKGQTTVPNEIRLPLHCQKLVAAETPILCGRHRMGQKTVELLEKPLGIVPHDKVPRFIGHGEMKVR